MLSHDPTTGKPLPRWRVISSLSFWKVSRWLTLISGIIIVSACGTPYMFGIYGPFIKERMGYTQSQINFVANIKDLGTYFGIFLGVFYDVFGPRTTSILSGILGFLGYFLVYLGLIFYFPTTHVTMGIFLMMMGLGSSALYTCAVAPNIYNFSGKNRGKVAGVLAALFGLSSAIFGQLYSLAFSNDMIHFIFFLSIFIGSVSLLGVVFFNYVEAPVSDQEQPLLKVNEGSEQAEAPPPNVNPLRVLLTLEFWLYMVSFTISSGSGLLLIDNLGSVWLSLGGQPGKDQDRIVIIFSLSNCFGRLALGFLSDQFRKHVSRAFMMSLSVMLMAIAMLVLSFSEIKLLYLGVVLTGIAYGGLWAMCPLITFELWGEKYWGMNFNLIGLAPALGSYLFGTVLAARLYEKEIVGGGTECFGIKCYQESFWICSGLCVAGSVIGLVMARLIKKPSHHSEAKAFH